MTFDGWIPPEWPRYCAATWDLGTIDDDGNAAEKCGKKSWCWASFDDG